MMDGALTAGKAFDDRGMRLSSCEPHSGCYSKLWPNITMAVNPTQLSKFLSFVLRHQPDAIGLSLDQQGWASVDDLIAKGNAGGTHFSREDLLRVIETSDKKRFSLSNDGQRIRAAQGHSVTVELGLSPQEPPGGAFENRRMG
jgi:RNA:NAD 2'-phosphotransferase (TPT1/KptA family)